MKILFTLFIFLLAFQSFAQSGPKTGLTENLKEFNRKAKVVEWLYKYDIAAWMTSADLDKQDKKEFVRLGKEWFCYQDSSEIWHAVYGKYDSGVFDQVFHYTIDRSSKIKRTFDKVDTLKLNSYSRALITANKEVAKVKDHINILFNQYIKQNQDKTFTVWFLPALQNNNVVVYGGEFIYTIDSTGNMVLKDDSYYQGKFPGFKIGKSRSILIDYSELETPTIGAIFFVWTYKKYFSNIYIQCAKSKSTVIQDKNKNYTWVHSEK